MARKAAEENDDDHDVDDDKNTGLTDQDTHPIIPSVIVSAGAGCSKPV